eukprot:SAG22_NODE_4252_length_1327_cov_1.052117_3_plen_157_part_00
MRRQAQGLGCRHGRGGRLQVHAPPSSLRRVRYPARPRERSRRRPASWAAARCSSDPGPGMAAAGSAVTLTQWLRPALAATVGITTTEQSMRACVAYFDADTGQFVEVRAPRVGRPRASAALRLWLRLWRPHLRPGATWTLPPPPRARAPPFPAPLA